MNATSCALPADGGRCRGNFERWAFNEATGDCERFAYGGCGGNGNRFMCKEMCMVSKGGKFKFITSGSLRRLHIR